MLGVISLPQIDYTTILPELIALGGSILLLAVSAVSPRRLPSSFYASTTSGIGIASLIASLILYHDVQKGGAFVAVAHSIAVDGFSALVDTLASCVLIVAPMLAASFLERERLRGPEYYALACISVGGAMLMGAANDLILIFLALEVLSIPLYVMAGLDHRREASGEAAMKYFLLGAFSSAVFVYGVALVYGATGSTNLVDIAAFLAKNLLVSNGILYAGMALLLVGFAFKIAAVPFHMWTPDVYQGSPTPAVGFMASIAKIGGFTALLRVFVSSFPTLTGVWQPAIWIIAILTLLLGAIAALVQRDVKRMLAYSSINHAGFILLGLQAATTRGVTGSLYYLFTYSLLVLGSFGVVAVVGGRGDRAHSIEQYRGLWRRNPYLAVTFALLLLAQAGVPFTTGFFAKLYVVEAAVDAHSYALAVVAMASAAIAAFFYLRVVFVMFGDGGRAGEPVGEPALAEEAGGLLLGAPGMAAGASPLVGAGVAFAGVGAGSGGGAGAGGGVLAGGQAAAFSASGASTGALGPLGSLGSPSDVAAAGAEQRADDAGQQADDAETTEPAGGGAVSPWTWTGLALTLGATIVFGIWPQPLVEFASQAHLLF